MGPTKDRKTLMFLKALFSPRKVVKPIGFEIVPIFTGLWPDFEIFVNFD